MGDESVRSVAFRRFQNNEENGNATVTNRTHKLDVSVKIANHVYTDRNSNKVTKDNTNFTTAQ